MMSIVIILDMWTQLDTYLFLDTKIYMIWQDFIISMKMIQEKYA